MILGRSEPERVYCFKGLKRRRKVILSRQDINTARLTREHSSLLFNLLSTLQ